jgi:hypothetical protein
MSILLKRCAVGAVACAVMLFGGCSSSSKTPAADESAAKAPVAPPELVTAKTAFWPMDKAAVTWASDAVPLDVKAQDLTGFTNEGGKAAMWEATFGSRSLGAQRDESYAITTILPSIHKGVTAGLKEPWRGETQDVMAIDPSTFQVDSDAAYQTATQDAYAWLKKNPDKKLTSMVLGNASRLHGTVWAVVWGDKKSGYVVYVDANSGKVLKGK